MATINHLFDLQEQICYVQCSFCTTILLVSVPYSSLSMVVTVRCGHCTSLLSVNMLKASFVPLHLFAALRNNEDDSKLKQEARPPDQLGMDSHSTSLVASSDHDHDEEDDIIPINHVVNKPPEKKKRAPSAYNKFIK
ncbi:hypothetical protein Ancab_020477 [Ancistrocladus abbreviatus]